MISQQDYDMMRLRLGRANVKRADPVADDAVEKEADLQQQIRNFLVERRWAFVWSPMHSRTSTGIGVVDFVIAAPKGRTLWVEAKTRTSKLRPEQIGFKMLLEAQGHEHHVVRSYREFSEAIYGVKFTKKHAPAFTADAGINPGREP